jgi:hypothetical protein
MYCGSGGMSVTGTIPQVSSFPSILLNVPNVSPLRPFSTSFSLPSFLEFNLIQRVNYGGIHRITGSKSFGQRT